MHASMLPIIMKRAPNHETESKPPQTKIFFGSVFVIMVLYTAINTLTKKVAPRSGQQIIVGRQQLFHLWQLSWA